MHERHAEGEVRFVWVIALPESVGVENADIEQPPYEACSASSALPSWCIGVMKLIDHIYSASVLEVVSDGLRAGQLVDLTSFTPALQRCAQTGIDVVVEQEDEPLILPST